MHARFQNIEFGSNCSANSFKILGRSMQVGATGAEYGTDTTLRLDSFASPMPYASARGIKRKWNLIDGSLGQEADSLLSLRLGHSSSSSDSKGSSATASTEISSTKETEEESSMDIELEFSLHLGNEKTVNSKSPATSDMKGLQLMPKVDLELSLSSGGSCESEITFIQQNQSQSPVGLSGGVVPTRDEGSTSCVSRPWVVSPPLRVSTEEASFVFSKVSKEDDLAPPVLDLSSVTVTTPMSSVSCTSGITQQQKPQHRNSSSKFCQVEGCQKGARGASGRCISHGGGRRCQKSGCHKGAEGRTVFCKAHGGGRRCEFLGCTKSAEGRTDFCIAHGGGRRCSHEACARAARGKSGLCIRHGGGKRCQRENCTKSAEGLSGLCISHGGGRRCHFSGCTKGAQGSTMFCKAHGGGKRCTYPGCTKGAEGSTPFCKGHGGGKRCAFQGGGVCTKSVHGGTNFCVAHGGGKRCAMSGCTKSARGRTDFCVRHGGGKRCKFQGCNKSAQGSTDFCKAHGGGKRCVWGHPGTEYAGQPSGPCSSFARGKTGLCALHSSLVQDKRVHGGIPLGPVIQGPKLSKMDNMKNIPIGDSMNSDILKMRNSVGSLGSQPCVDFSAYEALSDAGEVGVPSTSAVVPEGRVHGGSLMAMLAGGSGLRSSSGRTYFIGDPSVSSNAHVLPGNWA